MYKQLQLKKMDRVIPVLEKLNYHIDVVDSLEQARESVLSKIEKNSSISMGGSTTLEQLKLAETFRSKDYNFFDRFNQPNWPKTVECMRNSLLSDWLITGTNAITMDGILVQIDSGANRVASMIYGPKNMVIVTGINKIVDTLDEAYARLRKAGVLNAKRLNHQTPCNITGICEDCRIKTRMCNFMSLLYGGKRENGSSAIIFIKEIIGY